MKNKFLILFSLLLIVACSKQEENKKTETAKVISPKTNMHEVVVKKKIDAPPYSYLKVEENGKEYWMAANRMNVKAGDKIYYSNAMTMRNFHSKTLNKTFDEILFVQDASATMPGMGKKSMIEMAHYGIAKEQKVKVKISPVKGGATVGEIYAKKNELAGKTVKVKGKVVKFNPEILGRNWIHIQDGTDYNGKYDLLITSQAKVNVGDVVVFEGKVAVNKDFGAGYVYEVLLENGKLLK